METRRLKIFFVALVVLFCSVASAQTESIEVFKRDITILMGSTIERVFNDYKRPLTQEEFNKLSEKILGLADLVDNMKELDQKQATREEVEKGLNDFLQSLDHNSELWNPAKVKEKEEMLSGKYCGIGVLISTGEKEKAIIGEKGLLIERAFPGSPAEKAGLEKGDRIEKINQETISGLLINEAADKLSGPKGTLVQLTIRKKGMTAEQPPQEVTIRRDKIITPVLESKVLANGMGYINLYGFVSPNTDEQFLEALCKLEKQGATNGIILDIRNNSGGSLAEVNNILDIFLPENSAKYQTKDRRIHFLSIVGRTKTPQIFKKIPLVVLVNEFSASASELLAGAVQDNKRAKIIGIKTYGKGTVQVLVGIGVGYILKLTIQEWFTANGNKVDGVGISPDFDVEDDPLTVEDEVLDWAENFLNGKIYTH